MYEVTYSLPQHTLQILMVFDIQSLQKHEAANGLQPTRHLTHQSHTLVPLTGFPHTILLWDSQLQCDHLSECLRQQKNVDTTVSWKEA